MYLTSSTCTLSLSLPPSLPIFVSLCTYPLYLTSLYLISVHHYSLSNTLLCTCFSYDLASLNYCLCLQLYLISLYFTYHSLPHLCLALLSFTTSPLHLPHHSITTSPLNLPSLSASALLHCSHFLALFFMLFHCYLSYPISFLYRFSLSLPPFTLSSLCTPSLF